MHRASARAIVAIVGLVAFVGSAQAQLIVSDFVQGGFKRFNAATGEQLPRNLISPATTFGPASSTVGPDGNLYVSNQFSSTIDKYDPRTGRYLGNVANLGLGYSPAGIRFGPDGNLYIAKYVQQFDTSPNGLGSIDRFNLANSTLTTVVPNLRSPTNLLFIGNDLLFSEFSNGSTARVGKYNLTSSNVSTFIPGAGLGGMSGLYVPTGLTLGPDGNVYVLDVAAQQLLRYNQSGALVGSGPFASGIGGGFNNPGDLLFAYDRLYVANLGDFSGPNGFVSYFDPVTGAYEGQLAHGFVGASSLTLLEVGRSDKIQLYPSLDSETFASVAVPEPSSLALLGCTLGGAWWARRRRPA